MNGQRLLKILTQSPAVAIVASGFLAVPPALVLAEQDTKDSCVPASDKKKQVHQRDATKDRSKLGFGGRDDVGSRDDDEWEDGLDFFSPQNAGVVSTVGVCVPFGVMCCFQKIGLNAKIFNAVYKKFGVYGLLFFPLFSIVFEKGMYDTLNALCGKDVSLHPETGAAVTHNQFPSGGHMLPSLSLVEVRKRKQQLQTRITRWNREA